MPSVWLVSDTHFGHANICKFTNYDGTPVRPWDDVNEMDEALVKNWNSVVKPKDKVYHLGDVVINRKSLDILYRLNGDKILIKGNHDIFKLNDYAAHFRDIRAFHVMNKIIISHVPVHPDCLERFKGNIHGHLHGNIVKDKYGKPDTRYVNVSVELTNYTPILFEEVSKRFDELNDER